MQGAIALILLAVFADLCIRLDYAFSESDIILWEIKLFLNVIIKKIITFKNMIHNGFRFYTIFWVFLPSENRFVIFLHTFN